MKSPITSHVLDTGAGRPAAGVPVSLRTARGVEIARAKTDADGRLLDWLPKSFAPRRGVYEIIFDTKSYFKSRRQIGFYPEVRICFELADPKQHYHVPLLLSPWGFSTYRGS